MALSGSGGTLGSLYRIGTGDPLFGDIAVQQVGGFVEPRGRQANGLRIDAGDRCLLRADANDEHCRGDRQHGRCSFSRHAPDTSTRKTHTLKEESAIH